MSARAAAAGLALAMLAAGCGDAPDARNCVLITLDTTRRDALGAFGGPAGVTPRLDELAAESRLYLGARTVAPLTLPAHASMLTGLYPPRHTVHDNALTPLPAEAVTLAERARERGIATGAFVAAAVLSRVYGVDQGFDVYDEPDRSDEDHTFADRRAEEVTARATQWLAGLDDDARFFLWAHYFDPHKPWQPGEFLDQGKGDPYLGCVARMDAGVGALLDALRARDDWDETLVIVVADHGEGLGDHGEETHSVFVYDTTIRVPMIVRLPPKVGGPGAVETAASVADVFPTALDLLELGAAGDVDGQSLRTPPPPERGVYFESYYGRIYHGWSPLVGWADAAGKYVHASRPELYDPARDPGETQNLAGERDAAPYLAALERVAQKPALAPEARMVDRSMVGALEDLGYAGAGGTVEIADPLALDPDRKSPHEHPDLLALTVRAWNLSSRGLHAEAVQVLGEVVERDPTNHGAWSRLARSRAALGDLAGAAQAFERVIALDVPWPEDRFLLGVAYRDLGRPEDAARAFEAGLALDARNETALVALIEVYTELGRATDAARALSRLEDVRAGR